MLYEKLEQVGLIQLIEMQAMLTDDKSDTMDKELYKKRIAAASKLMDIIDKAINNIKVVVNEYETYKIEEKNTELSK